jgi:tRNA uridine 5-carbamoylmethylation protein Kti12
MATTTVMSVTFPVISVLATNVNGAVSRMANVDRPGTSTTDIISKRMTPATRYRRPERSTQWPSPWSIVLRSVLRRYD